MLRNIYFSIVTFLLIGSGLTAQNTAGGIKVLLKDKANGESIPFANVVAYQGGVQVGVGTTDMDGYAMIKPLSPGKYDVKGVYVGFQAQEIKGILVGESKTAYITIELSNGGGVDLGVVDIVAYQVPLIDPDTKTGKTVDRESYQNMATKNVNSVAATTAGVYQSDEGADLNVRGGRSGATTYFVDGVKVIGGLGLPQQGIEQLSVITGGLPAQYGDATAGIISVTTRGPQSKFFGGVELISSQLTDKYGYNSLGFSVGGPILKKTDTNGVKTPVIGFFLSGQGTYQKDPDPSYNKMYKLNNDKLKEIQDKPLRLSPSGDGFVQEQQFLTKSDFEQVAARQNVSSRGIALNGKLDFKVTPNTNLTLGGVYEYGNANAFVYRYSLTNFQNNPQQLSNTWRAYARINQKFGIDQTATEKEKSQAVISNAYFTFLASYEQTKSKVQNPTHKSNFFNYGYVGKFNYAIDTTRYIKIGTPDSSYYTYLGRVSGPVTFERSDVNEFAANYTSQLFDYYGTLPTINDISSLQGIVNGRNAGATSNNLFTTVGQQYDNYSLSNNTQIRFSSSFSADIKNHAIMVGVEYDQRNESSYGLDPVGLWNRMRLLTNSHLKSLDNPYLVSELNPTTDPNNNHYYARYKYNPEDQTQIDKSLREMLGMSTANQTFINTDALNPDDLKLDMFSAKDLLGNGVEGTGELNTIIRYNGYDYLGNKNNKSTSIESFLNDKDKNGNNLYSVGAYKPIYVAGYIQDKFDYKDIKFNVGVRVDRFDANQKVLKDKYLFQEAYTAGEKVTGRPQNISENATVYVDDAKLTTPTILGYREGDIWYNSEGTELSDPSIIVQNGKITPWLKESEDFISKNQLNSKAFTDYKPQINVMPRIAFSFPISDIANFFAHYDVLTQRPTASMQFNPMDYYFISSTSANPFITNPNLKPTRTIDYELGYNQILNEKKNAALKITAFYRELRDMITTQTINQAYPKTYYTYVNKDFGTVKGMSLEFDLRRTGGVSVNANYTLQFADGSGSNANSGANLASTGQPNLRVTLPLEYDQRHNFVLTFDYRFGEKKDYKGPQYNRKKKDGTSQTVQIFQNVGANLQFLTGSGTPYTRRTVASPIGANSKSAIAGSLNGSLKPWQLRTNLRVDKNIELTWGKKESDERKTANLNVYVQVLNLFNTKNILNVYDYTGSADDDGYLASPQGVQGVANTVSPTAYTDQYNIFINNPNNYSRPRVIRIGVLLDF